VTAVNKNLHRPIAHILFSYRHFVSQNGRMIRETDLEGLSKLTSPFVCCLFNRAVHVCVYVCLRASACQRMWNISTV